MVTDALEPVWCQEICSHHDDMPVHRSVYSRSTAMEFEHSLLIEAEWRIYASVI